MIGKITKSSICKFDDGTPANQFIDRFGVMWHQDLDGYWHMNFGYDGENDILKIPYDYREYFIAQEYFTNRFLIGEHYDEHGISMGPANGMLSYGSDPYTHYSRIYIFRDDPTPSKRRWEIYDPTKEEDICPRKVRNA